LKLDKLQENGLEKVKGAAGRGGG